MLADVHADRLTDGQLLADVAVNEALDNVFAALYVDYHVVAEHHDGADGAGEVARASGRTAMVLSSLSMKFISPMKEATWRVAGLS